jgi:hypothetical protein
LRIITPLPSDTLFDTETIFFAGEATPEGFGLLPDGSLWWTEDGIEIGRGRHIQHLASVGRHTFGFHARYGERSDSVLLAASVMTTMGRVLWTAPLAGSDEGLALSPDGVIYAQDGSAVVAVGPDGELERSSGPSTPRSTARRAALGITSTEGSRWGRAARRTSARTRITGRCTV